MNRKADELSGEDNSSHPASRKKARAIGSATASSVGDFNPDDLLREPLHTISIPAAFFREEEIESTSLCKKTLLGELCVESLEPPRPDPIEAFDKVWRFVQSIQVYNSTLGEAYKKCDDFYSNLFRMTENLVKDQERMRELGRDTHIDIGYHYTNQFNLAQIERRGLLTKAERESQNIFARHNGSAYGDGIYTGNNMFGFMGGSYGYTGILVARLRGNERSNRRGQWEEDEDSRVSGSWDSIAQMVILKESSQCIPLLSFNVELLDFSDELSTNNVCDQIHKCHVYLQTVIDTVLNDGNLTFVKQVNLSESPQFRRIKQRKLRLQQRRDRQVQRQQQSLRQLQVTSHLAGSTLSTKNTTSATQQVANHSPGNSTSPSDPFISPRPTMADKAKENPTKQKLTGPPAPTPWSKYSVRINS